MRARAVIIPDRMHGAVIGGRVAVAPGLLGSQRGPPMPHRVGIRALLLLSLTTRAGAGTLWGVTTTIFNPTPAVQTFIDALPHAKLVVVGDLKTNHSAWTAFALTTTAVKYLSPEEQRSLPFASVAALPWNHFGRKNVGFLYAIRERAEWIFDFDDDNVLRTPLTGGLLHAIMAPELRTQHALIQPATHLYNPYPDFRPETADGKETFVWPRGFPLDSIHDPRTYGQPTWKHSQAASDVHIYQSLANNNPDVDAIYRMTRELPLSFAAQNKVLALPNGTYAPMNAQATLFRATAAWGLVLPVTVSPRVTDIWRSYITERLLWEMGGRVAFTSAMVTQYRNPHSYQKDFDDEVDVYVKVSPLLALLANWTSVPGASLAEAYVGLLRVLVDAEILQARDLELGELWVRDLEAAGYAWPAISTPQTKRHHSPAPIIDERRNELQSSVLSPAHDRSRGAETKGRTAVCLTGFPRSLSASFPDGVDKSYPPLTRAASPSVFDVGQWTVNTAWAGQQDGSVDAAAHPDWKVAQSIRNNVLSVLSNNGGYDLFLVEPGLNHNSTWDVLRPKEKSTGTPDGFFLSLGGPEPDLWYNKSDPRWRHWFYAKRFGLNHAHTLIEQFLYQLKHMEMCNNEVRKHTAATGVQYTYKMRLRPDFAWAAPIPSPDTLREQLNATQILTSSNLFFGSYVDLFAFGATSAMDVYFDRLPYVHSFERRYVPATARDLVNWKQKPAEKETWAAEQFLLDHLDEHGIRLVSHPDFFTFPVRKRDTRSGGSERVSFVNANGGHTDMKKPDS